MGKVADMISKLQLLTPQAMEQIVLATILKNQNEVLDLNIAQLQEGLTSENEKVAPPYSALTVEIKKTKGQPTDRVTLKDEGDFYRGFYFERGEFPLIVNSTDWKADKLTDKYGNNIFGFNKQNKTYIAKEIVQPELIRTIREFIRI
jgi:hypothetical protein